MEQKTYVVRISYSRDTRKYEMGGGFTDLLEANQFVKDLSEDLRVWASLIQEETENEESVWFCGGLIWSRAGRK